MPRGLRRQQPQLDREPGGPVVLLKEELQGRDMHGRLEVDLHPFVLGGLGDPADLLFPSKSDSGEKVFDTKDDADVPEISTASEASVARSTGGATCRTASAADWGTAANDGLAWCVGPYAAGFAAR